MTLWTPDGKILIFETVLQILEVFAPVRLDYYGKRKTNLLVKLRRECEFLKQKSRFITMVIDGQIIVAKKKREILVHELVKNNFLTRRQVFAKYYDEFTKGDIIDGGEEDIGAGAGADDEEGGVAKKAEKKGGFEYLMGMPLWSMTYERVEDLRKQLHTKQQEVTELDKTALEDLWERDLAALEATLKEIEAEDKMNALAESKIKGSAKTKRGATRAELNRRKGTAAVKRKAEIKKEELPESDEEEAGASSKAKRRKLSVDQIEELVKPPTDDKSNRAFLARLKERQAERDGVYKKAGFDMNAALKKDGKVVDKAEAALGGGLGGFGGLGGGLGGFGGGGLGRGGLGGFGGGGLGGAASSSSAGALGGSRLGGGLGGGGLGGLR